MGSLAMAIHDEAYDTHSIVTEVRGQDITTSPHTLHQRSEFHRYLQTTEVTGLLAPVCLHCVCDVRSVSHVGPQINLKLK